ncbi:MAG: three-Cys-motif partner protein TcmP [Bacteroidales bacterium]|nr:three-Cys-motif partner protein TcmP [Bacteroidales bacterium]MDD4500870.1 three-Cys-motif partner protein TcmP [Bacteroidales bacterium]
MPRKNIHCEPFSEETITKLEIFESYAGEWLPIFIMAGAKVLCIFDFFAGTGHDSIGVPGSPIRILTKIKKQIELIVQKKTKVHFFVNEYDAKKFEFLKESCELFLAENPEINRAGVKLHYFNKDFAELYDILEPCIGKYPSLVYLDQNGVKFTADKYFLNISQKPTTDFLYYISSSYVKRFGSTEEFKKVFKVNMDEVCKKPYKYIHQTILEYLRARLPNGSHVRLYPFTIKKHTNYYGIIFGASNDRAIDKFLKTVWDVNGVNGAANFDIDDDVNKSQGVLFGEQPLTKIQSFQKKLRELILTGEIKTNFDAFKFTLNEGHIGKHAMLEIKKMKEEGLISYHAKSPKVNYEAAIKTRDIITYKITAKQ